MKKTAVHLVLITALTVSLPNAILAKGSGGGHGGSHSGGHSGGHSSSHGGAKGGPAAHGGGARHGGTATASSSAASVPAPLGASSSRTRGSAPAVGTAVPRSAGVAAGGIVPPSASIPYHVWPYSSALGVSLYDPFWGFAYPVYGYGYAPDPFDRSTAIGGLRLKITPKTAEVFVDGYYVGIVDDLDGHFQHLNLTAGPHHIDVRAPGYDAFGLDVSIQPHHTTEYRNRLQPVAP